ncbi:hypothetical protein [Pseudorhodoferax sp.]|uniref:hypothetical protein n=1 Tax=Pseudorhodoferax sp. TaxID=1993553 RepID=UPI002DD61AC5|nr:hypothetical protein [Pseudorhodoferax sp.]
MLNAGAVLVDRRHIVSGMGDRMANMLCVAALARARGLQCLIQWRNDPLQPHRQYDWQALRRHMGVPDGVHVVDDVDAFDFAGARCVELRTQGNELPATNAYDCIYTLAHRALGGAAPAVNAAEMASSYRSVCAEWTVDPPNHVAPPFARYVALHLRGTDKRTPRIAFDTAHLLRQLLPHVQVVVVSDDGPLRRRFLQKFPSLWSHPDTPDETLSILRDWKTLLGASAIVQHSLHGWSAFSSVAAMARGIPLLNTYALRRRNLLVDFARYSGLPAELRSTTTPGALAAFVAAQRAAH